MKCKDEQRNTATSVEELRQRVLDEIENLGFRITDDGLEPIHDTKDFRRVLHAPAREKILRNANHWLKRAWKKHSSSLAKGKEVVPEQISPELIEVTSRNQGELFRLARYTWSLPYTKGYGRRLRFLLIDKSNGKLIGVLGLQSPPLSFPARDKLFSYPEGEKTKLVNQTMDIYTLGAVPPYSRLLGAKLVALASASDTIRKAYRRKYQGRITEMEERELPPHLVALTTTSAYGRSSIYNRLHYQDTVAFESLGMTEGYGAFHLDRLYPAFREFLENQDISTKGGFGSGPRIKWQTMVRALSRLGLDNSFLKHNVKREAFLVPLIRNLREYMEDPSVEPDYIEVSFKDLVDYWRERWLMPRSERVDGWHKWDPTNLEEVLLIKQNKEEEE